MEYSELLDYIDLFREKAEKGKLVIFVGAGVSCNVDGMPSWNDLIIQMAKAIGYSRCTSCKHKTADCEKTCRLKYDFSTEDFLKIPQYVFNYDRTLYNQVLSKSITPTVVDAPLSSAIFNINPVHIITTNYDQLLESSKHIFREQYEVIVHDKDLLTTDKSKYIIKMHGDMADPESMVLKEQDYLNYSHNHVLIEHFIKSLVADHIVLFLGYSL
ncbi:MAG: SIR2 family protein, partial [Allobaculum sp.]|nr:SIR2 family protein [Allobaculum sp.]